MFGLDARELNKRILGCGDGPASFNAEMSVAGHSVISTDPLYAYSGEQIAARFETASTTILDQVRATPERWAWRCHRNPDDLLTTRREVLSRFLADYGPGRTAGRYLAAALPKLPLADHSFGLAVCSHLLFLYSEQLSEAFHIESIQELCRVAGEVRVFPLLNLDGRRSPFVAPVRASLERSGWTSEICRVDYELQKGANEMLRIFRP